MESASLTFINPLLPPDDTRQGGRPLTEIRLAPGELANCSEGPEGPGPSKAIGVMGRKLPDSKASCTGRLGVVFEGGRSGG